MTIRFLIWTYLLPCASSLVSCSLPPAPVAEDPLHKRGQRTSVHRLRIHLTAQYLQPFERCVSEAGRILGTRPSCAAHHRAEGTTSMPILWVRMLFQGRVRNPLAKQASCATLLE